MNNSGIKFAFHDPLTGQIRWGMTAIVWILIAAAIIFGYITIRDKSKAQQGNDKTGNGTGNTTGSPYGGTTGAGQTTPNWVNEDHQKWVNDLKRVNKATYWACWGLNDPKERCEIWDKFTQLSDPDQKAIAGLYNTSVGTMLRKDVEDIDNICVCYKLTDGNVKFRLLQNLYRLGV